jgi:cyclic-di-AMP phosphodiesterase PgpH
MSKQIKELRSPFAKWQSKIADFVKGPISRVSPNQRFWIGFATLSIVTTVLIFNPFFQPAGAVNYQAGDIARESVISPADIYFVDEEETERQREEKRNAQRPIFRYESNKADQAVQQFLSSWERLQRHDDGAANNNKASNSDVKAESHWTGAGGPEVGRIFAARDFTRNELDAVASALREASQGYIYDDAEVQYFANEVEVFDRSRPNLRSMVTMPETSWTSLSTARNKFRSRLQVVRSLSEKEIAAFYTAGEILIEPTVSYDSVATDQARAASAAAVDPRTIILKRGQTIVDAGQRIDPTILSQIAAVNNYSATTRWVNKFFGLLVLISILFWIAWKFIEHRGIVPRLALSEQKTFALFGSIVVVHTVLMTIFFRLAEFTASQNVRPPMNDPSIWSYAIPFAFGSLVMTLLADRRTALFTGIFSALLAGLMAPRGLEFTIYAIIASSVAAYGIGRYRTRQTVTLAGALVGVTGAGVAIALIAFTQQPFILNTILLAIACGLASGIITSAFTAVFLPMFETMFGVLTDVKLLELSNADLPVLGQLALRAPGTNQHSHAVGQLAEEACRTVGGNALLARIGALYHDIGKTAAPEHFVENQLGKNPHDRLKPQQSAKIIISHVTYGTKLGKEMGLPQRIIDFIPQHHGTRTLHYFLKKAQAEAREPEDISENDFRYPGPKPQFREAAIMMIADSCEAAARSLAEPNPENIRFIVTKIIDAILSDDQLDECDLTLRELTQIRESMIRSLVAIYHSRVDYPGYVPPQSGQYKIVPEDLPGKDHGHKFTDPADIPISKGGEIEDEAFETEPRSETREAKSGG